MQSLKEITKQEHVEFDLQKNFLEASKDKEFTSLVQTLELTSKEAMKITSKLQEAVEEKKHCKECKGFYMCKNLFEGHRYVPEKREERIYFSYLPCKFQQAVFEKEKQKTKKNRMKDIDTTDKNQLKIIKWLDEFYSSYDVMKSKKGLYLHGSFGSGKTFLLSALLNELCETKHASVEIVYFPDALRTLKEDWDSFASVMHRYETVDLLLLDDIGAEKVTDWGRDEILGTILQTRMNEEKATFFTSNLTIQELETHLSLSSTSTDKVKARRIIERIKQLSIEMALVSENRRD